MEATSGCIVQASFEQEPTTGIQLSQAKGLSRQPGLQGAARTQASIVSSVLAEDRVVRLKELVRGSVVVEGI